MTQLAVFPRTELSDSAESGVSPKTVCILGLGYIGLPTASVLAERGYRVHGVDIRPEVVETINRGEIHIHEPGLAELVSKVVASGHLTASTQPVEADVFFICVPTPHHSDHSPDLSFVAAAAKTLRPFIRPGNLLILESTSPPGTTIEVVIREAIKPSLTVGKDVFVAYCPERVLPGRILIEVVENDRVVGGMTPQCTQRAVAFYDSFVRGQVLATDAVTAEMVKLIENAYRDVNIAFANEVSIMAERFGVDPFEIIELANRHPRVNILSPGPGVGGHCISVDPWFLVHAAPDCTNLIRTAREVNNSKPHHVIGQVKQAAAAFVIPPTIGCLGLAYKANVDDLRESPSLEICRELNREFPGRVLACDPYVRSERLDDLRLASLADTLAKSDVLVLLTDHAEFRDLPALARPQQTLIDTRGFWRQKPATRTKVAA